MPLNACTCSPDVNNAGIGFSMTSEVNSLMTDYFFHSSFFLNRGTTRQKRRRRWSRGNRWNLQLWCHTTGASPRTGKQLWNSKTSQRWNASADDSRVGTKSFKNMFPVPGWEGSGQAMQSTVQLLTMEQDPVKHLRLREKIYYEK